MFPQQTFITPYQLFFKCLELALACADREYDESKGHHIYHKLCVPGVFNGNERTLASFVNREQEGAPSIPEMIDEIIRYEYETRGPRPTLYNSLELTREGR